MKIDFNNARRQLAFAYDDLIGYLNSQVETDRDGNFKSLEIPESDIDFLRDKIQSLRGMVSDICYTSDGTENFKELPVELTGFWNHDSDNW